MKTFWIFAIVAALIFQTLVQAGMSYNLTEKVERCLVDDANWRFPKQRDADNVQVPKI